MMGMRHRNDHDLQQANYCRGMDKYRSIDPISISMTIMFFKSYLNGESWYLKSMAAGGGGQCSIDVKIIWAGKSGHIVQAASSIEADRIRDGTWIGDG